jgi:hypothetical protein
MFVDSVASGRMTSISVVFYLNRARATIQRQAERQAEQVRLQHEAAEAKVIYLWHSSFVLTLAQANLTR